MASAYVESVMRRAAEVKALRIEAVTASPVRLAFCAICGTAAESTPDLFWFAAGNTWDSFHCQHHPDGA